MTARNRRFTFKLDSAVENRCPSLYRSPPTKKDVPRTSNMLDSTEPSSDSCVTRSMPARIAIKLTMTSVALPNVAFSRPPTVSLVYSASCSVMNPRRSASGHIASSENVNVQPSLHAELVGAGSQREAKSKVCQRRRRTVTPPRTGLQAARH